MKKSLFYSMLATTMLFATSCQQDEVFVDGNEAVVQFQISTPEIATRAYSDGMTATNLQYAVYDKDGKQITEMFPGVGHGEKEIKGSTTVELKLAQGNTYHVLFWASAEGAPYTVDFDTHKLTVDYNGYSNDESRDAFYKWHTVTVNSNEPQRVELRRPFAQLNIGTGDMQDAAAAGVTVATTKVTVTDVYNTLDFKEGSVTGEENVTFDYAAVPTNETFPVDGYDYLAMNYVLVPADKVVVDKVELTYTSAQVADETRTFTSIPLQRNYRTNIYGDLLTKGVDFIVEIVPTYTNDHLELWDGTMLRKPTVDDVNKTIKISEGSELAWFAALVNGELPSEMRATAPADALEGYTVSLECDIDLNNKAWTPIGVAGAVFKGTFDGNGHTIKNLNVDVTDKMVGDKPYSAGLFGSVRGTVKNLNIEKAVIKGNYKAGAVVGDGLCTRIENCHVSGAEIVSTPDANKDNANHVGGIVGYLSAEPTAWVKNCTVKNSTVTAYRDVAAIAGTANGSNALVEHNVAENVIVTADQTVAYKESGKAPNAGEIVGRNIANTDLSTNTAINVRLNAGKPDSSIKIYSLEDLKALATAVNNGDNYKGKTVVLMSDIDLKNEEWTPIGNSTNKFQGTFDGGFNTIKNLVITGNNSYVGLFGFTTDGEIKNLTIENANVSGYLAVGVVAGSPYTSKYTNITVKGHVEVNGFAYVGGVGGRNAYANWNNVIVDVDAESYVKANSVENGTAYRTYVGGVCGFNGEDGHSFTNITSNINVEGSTCDVGGLFGIAHYGNKFINCVGTGNVKITDAAEADEAEEIGGIAGVWHNGGADVTFTNCKFTGTLKTNITEGVDLSNNTIVGKAYSASGKGKLIIDGSVIAVTADELVAALESGQDVVLTEDVKIDPAGMSNAYGTTGINVKNGQTIDGGGHTLDIKGAGGTWDSGISTTGGLIKNIKVTGSFRGIFVNHNSEHKEKVVLDNVIIDGTTYTISCDQGTGEGLEAKESTFKGWTSYAATLGNAKFTDCYFGKGNGYSYCRPYAPTEFVGCEFEAGYRIDPRAAVTFENCTFGGVALTNANVADLVTNTANATVK